MLSAQRLQTLHNHNLRNNLISRFLRLQNIELFQHLIAAVESTILTLSDLQLFTSLAILTSGYAQLPRGISLYHWSTMVDLAWFSALAHLATLTALRNFFRKRPLVAIIRVLVMGIVLTLLSVAFFPTGYTFQVVRSRHWDLEDFEHPYKNPHIYYMSMPTQCLYSTSSKDAVLEHYNTVTVPPGITESGPPGFTFNAGLVSLSILFLVMSYGTRVVTIYPPLSQAFDGCIRGAPMNFLEKRYQTAKDKAPLPRFKYWNSFYKVLLLTVILIAEAWLEVGVPVFWQVLWLGSAVIWGTLRLAGLRRNMPLSDEAS